MNRDTKYSLLLLACCVFILGLMFLLKSADAKADDGIAGLMDMRSGFDAGKEWEKAEKAWGNRWKTANKITNKYMDGVEAGGRFVKTIPARVEKTSKWIDHVVSNIPRSEKLDLAAKHLVKSYIKNPISGKGLVSLVSADRGGGEPRPSIFGRTASKSKATRAAKSRTQLKVAKKAKANKTTQRKGNFKNRMKVKQSRFPGVKRFAIK